MIGETIGHYRIIAKLGAGGMGEVFRATDIRLHRDVALKFSVERFTERFEREARAVAALNHPNVCTLYDVGPNYLVMELVEGPTLAERIERGPIPTDEAIQIARHLADAIEAAHEKGIVHRDLKPSNIKVRPDGTVKVLDFGLAKWMSSEPAAISAEGLPTVVSQERTVEGAVLGTAAYMAPEQARGVPVDKRVDIWAFGVVVHEMLTGRQLFAGGSSSDTIAAVLTREPTWDRIPQQIRRLLARCLEKDPKRRLRDIGDVWQLLDEPQAPAKRSAIAWAVAACLAIVSAGGLWGWWSATKPHELTQPSIRLDLDLGPDVWTGGSTGITAILSPDGTQILSVSQSSLGVRTLFIRPLDQPKAVQLRGTEGAASPFFSPDGQWVGFFANGKLKKTRVDHGEPMTLCDAPAGRGAAWLADGTIVAALDTRAGLSRIGPDGRVTSVTKLEAGEATHRWPSVLPGDKGVVFTVSASPTQYAEASIAVLSLEAPSKKRIVVEKAGMSPHYLPAGQLVYVSNGTVYAVPFDLASLKVLEGPRTAVLEGVSADTTYGLAQLNFSGNGTALYRRGSTNGGRYTLQSVERSGTIKALLPEPKEYLVPRLAPDGTSRVAIVVGQGSNSDIWVFDWQKGNQTRLTLGLGSNIYPVWSPNGLYVFYQSVDGIYWARSDGTDRGILTKSQSLPTPTSLTPDGGVLVFYERNPDGGALIKTVGIDYTSGQPKAGEPKLFLQTPSASPFPTFSPNGHWLAYASNDDGPYKVYVKAYPDKGKRSPVSTESGYHPTWSRTRNELMYRSDNGLIMVVGYTVEGENFIAGAAKSFSGIVWGSSGMTPTFDLAPDGDHIAMLVPAEAAQQEETRGHFTLALNFFEEVRRLSSKSKP